MRVVFLVQGRNVPAARARGLTIARSLEKAGVECDLRAPHPSIYGDTGLSWPWSRMRFLFRPLGTLARLGHLWRLRPSDVVFFQRPLIEYPTTVVERLAARGRASVFDFDDAFFVDFGGRRKLRQIAALVDQVIAGNHYLAEQAGVPGKTTVIPTIVDTDRFRAQPTRDARGRDVVVGWTGLRGNYPQLLTAAAGIGRALRHTGARLLIISNGRPPRALTEMGAEYVPWRAASEIDDLARIDVGLMPLPDTVFARGKCAFKLIQYMALARPGVASPLGVNSELVTDGVDGFLPRSDVQWADSLIRLIEDPDLRARMGNAARKRIESAYSLSAVLPQYLELLARVGVTPRVRAAS